MSEPIVPQNSIIITTNSELKKIIDKTLKNVDDINDSCMFNTLLFTNIYDDIYQQLLTQFLKSPIHLQLGVMNGGKKGNSKKGKSKKRKYKKGKSKKGKSKKTRKNIQCGGQKQFHLLLFIIILFILGNGVLSIKNVTDNDILDRLVNSKKIIGLFKNTHGTCMINTASFLKNIGLKSHEELSIKKIQNNNENILSQHIFNEYAEKKLQIKWKWNSLHKIPSTKNIYNNSPRVTNLRGHIMNNEDTLTIKNDIIKNNIDYLHAYMIQMRTEFNLHNPNEGVVTAYVYPYASDINVAHVVTLWLNSKNELFIIDPQKYVRTDNIIIYSDSIPNEEFMNHLSTREITQYSLSEYFSKYLDTTNGGTHIIMSSIHSELSDNTSVFDMSTTKVDRTIQRIEDAKHMNSDL